MTSSRVPSTRPGRPIAGERASRSTAVLMCAIRRSAAAGLSASIRSRISSSRRKSGGGVELRDPRPDLADLPLVQFDISGDGFRREIRLRPLGAARQRIEPGLQRGIDPRRHDCGIVCAPRSVPVPDKEPMYTADSPAVKQPAMTNTILTLHDPAAARRYYAAGLWRDETMYALLAAHAAARPDAYALRDGTRRLTWRELLAAVDAVAADLAAAGLKFGERVAVWLPSRVESVIVLLACSRQGYICNPSLHQNYTVAEIAGLLERTNAAALFAQPGYGADARTADIFGVAAGIPSLRRVCPIGEFPAPGGAAPP